MDAKGVHEFDRAVGQLFHDRLGIKKGIGTEALDIVVEGNLVRSGSIGFHDLPFNFKEHGIAGLERQNPDFIQFLK